MGAHKSSAIPKAAATRKPLPGRVGGRLSAPQTEINPMLRLQQQAGNRAVGQIIQPKLVVGEPDDPHEREADRVAALVVQRMSAPAGAEPPPERGDNGNNQRRAQVKPINVLAKPSVGELRMKSGTTQGPQPAAAKVEASIATARGGGQPLDESLQRSMGEAMGADFKDVRVHTDGRADTLNRSLNARAFATGKDLFFKRGEYQTGNQRGKELIAHELAHVVQQENQIIRRKISIQGIEVKSGDDKDGEKIQEILKEIISNSDLKEDDKLAKIEIFSERFNDWLGDIKSRKYKDHTAAAESIINNEESSDFPSHEESEKPSEPLEKEIQQAKELSSSKVSLDLASKEKVVSTGKLADVQSKIQLTAEERAKKLAILLNQRSPNFEKCAKLLSIDSLLGVEQEIKSKWAFLIGDLKSSIKNKFNPFQEKYLLSHFEDRIGMPSFEAKVLLSCGLVSTPAVNNAEVVRLIEEATDQEKKSLKTSGNWPVIKKQLNSKARIYIFTLIDEVEINARIENNKELEGLKDEQAVALIEMLGARSFFKDKGRNIAQASDHIQAWAKRQTPAIRDYVSNEDSKLSRYLTKNLSDRREYILGLIRMDGYGDDVDEKTDLSSVQNAHELYLYLERKRKEGSKHRLTSWKTLADKIDALDETGRRELLEKLKDNSEQDNPELYRFYRPDLDLGFALDEYLRAIGITGKELERIVDALWTGGSAQKGSTLWQIKLWVERSRKVKNGKELVALLTELKGAEYSQLRINESLREKIYKELNFLRDGRKYSDQVTKLLGISNVARGAEQDSPGESIVENIAELRPEHWAIKIIYAAKEGTGPRGWSRNKILSLVTQVYYAAKRLQAMGKDNLPPGVSWMKPVDFTKAVLERVNKSKDGKNAINDSRLSAAKQALEECRAPTQDERIEGAIKRTGWANTEHTIQAIEDAKGIELLDGWTNIKDFRKIKEKLEKESDESKKKDLQAQVNSFVFFFTMETKVYNDLRAKLTSNGFAEVQEAFFQKIADAIENDGIFRRALEVEGMSVGALNAEVLRSLSALETERRDDSAMITLDWFSAKPAERRQAARGTSRELASSYLAIKSGSSQDVDAETLKQARENLSERRSAFIALKEKIKYRVSTTIAVILSIAGTVFTAGIGAPPGASLISSIVFSTLVGAIKGGVEKAFEGEAYSNAQWLAEMLQHAILAGVTVGAGQLSGVIQEGVAGFGNLDVFADKAANGSAVEVSLRTIAEKMMDLADPNRQEELPDLRSAADHAVNIFEDSILKTASEIINVSTLGKDESGDPANPKVKDSGRMSWLIFNELTTGQNFGVFEATSWPSHWQGQFFDALKSVYSKPELVNGDPLDDGSKVTANLNRFNEIQEARLKIIQKAYFDEGYSVRELKVYHFRLEEMIEALGIIDLPQPGGFEPKQCPNPNKRPSIDAYVEAGYKYQVLKAIEYKLSSR